MLESFYEVFFFSSLRIGNIIFDLVLPIIFVIVIYDGLFRWIAKVNYWQVFGRKIKHIVLNLLARILLLYAFVFIGVGINYLVPRLADYWLFIVIVIALFTVGIVIVVMMNFSPQKKEQPRATDRLNQAERFRRYRE